MPCLLLLPQSVILAFWEFMEKIQKNDYKPFELNRKAERLFACYWLPRRVDFGIA